jgi:hypothetical protein
MTNTINPGLVTLSRATMMESLRAASQIEDFRMPLTIGGAVDGFVLRDTSRDRRQNIASVWTDNLTVEEGHARALELACAPTLVDIAQLVCWAIDDLDPRTHHAQPRLVKAGALLHVAVCLAKGRHRAAPMPERETSLQAILRGNMGRRIKRLEEALAWALNQVEDDLDPDHQLQNREAHCALENTPGPREAELRELEDWLRGASCSTSEDYAGACDRAQQLRAELGLPPAD